MNAPSDRPPDPPRFARWILERVVSRDVRRGALGDFDEIHARIAAERGEAAADRWYRAEALRSIVPFIAESIRFALVLAANQLRVAVRLLRRQKAYAVINVVGLAVGLACCLLIVRYVRDERSYDRHFAGVDRLFRVTLDRRGPGQEIESAATPRPLADVLATDFPEVNAATRLSRERAERLLVRSGDDARFEDGFVFADSNFFSLFPAVFLRGDPSKALERPFSVVITDRTAERYFGTADPIGRTLSVRLRGDGDFFDYTVTGVVRALPRQTHFHFDFLATYRLHPFATDDDGTERADWTGLDVYTYVRLRPDASPEQFGEKLPGIVDRTIGPFVASRIGRPFAEYRAEGNGFTFGLQPVTDIHLRSGRQKEFEPVGSESTVRLLSLVALFILGIAVVNFVNLATARAVRRSREVGVRKALGSHRRQLAGQFLVESIVLEAPAFLLAVVLAEIALPVFNRLAGTQLPGLGRVGPRFWLELAVLCLATGLAAGFYPALRLSAYRPARVLHGSVTSAGRARLRGVLVVLQFFIAIGLVVTTLVMAVQMRYVRHKALGFDRDHALVVEGTEILRSRTETFRRAVASVDGVQRVAHAETVPGRPIEQSRFRVDGMADETGVMLSRVYAGFDFVETLGMRLVEGRAPSAAFGTDSTAVVLNQSAVRALGLDDPIGRRIVRVGNGLAYNVVGVVADFHFDTLRNRIGPLAIFGPDPFYSNRPRQLVVARLKGNDLPEIVDNVGAVWKRFVPGQPFRYAFLDEGFDTLYRSEVRLETLLAVFAGIAIVIACLGLFGLSAFMAEQRRREIGIRKALGASAGSITLVLIRDLLRPVAVAFVVAVPVAVLASNRWLEQFAYRVDPVWTAVLVTALLTVTVSVLSVGIQSGRAARTDPVRCLRAE